jgi:poly(beta-D-mannuronate) lyase
VDENKTYLQPLRDFDFRLSTITTEYLRSPTNGLVIAACALAWLDTWAVKDFMVKAPALATNDPNWWQLQYERAFLGASIAQHYAAISGQAGLNATVKARVAAWLVRMGTATYQFSIYREQHDPVYRYNNIYAWMGLHMLVIGQATGNTTLINRGIYSFKACATKIRADGLITTELERKEKAFWYHNYFLRPMYMMAEIMVNNGVNLYNYKSSSTTGTIATAGVRLVREYMTNMRTFPGAATQISSSNPAYFLTDNTGQLDWMEIFRLRFHTTENGSAPLLVKARKVWLGISDIAGGTIKSKCGANGTVSYGVRTP